MTGRGAMVVLFAACAAGAVGAPAGCAAGGRATGWGAGVSTVYTPGDMEEIARRARESLVASEFLTGRSPGSAKIVLQPAAVRNVSSERVDRADQWAALTRVLYAPGVLAAMARANVDVLQAEAARVDAAPGGAWAGAAPTHAMNVVFASVKRAGTDGSGPADDRKDVFSVDYEIVEIASRVVVWSESVVVARAASGLLVD